MKAIVGAIIGVVAVLFGVFLRRKKPVEIGEAPKEPEKEVSQDFVKDYEEKVNESNKKVDEMSRDNLINSLNKRYK